MAFIMAIHALLTLCYLASYCSGKNAPKAGLLRTDRDRASRYLQMYSMPLCMAPDGSLLPACPAFAPCITAGDGFLRASLAL